METRTLEEEVEAKFDDTRSDAFFGGIDSDYIKQRAEIAYKRYEHVKGIIKGDEETERWLNNIVEYAINYAYKSIISERKIREIQMGDEETIEKNKRIMEVDRSKRITHNAFIDSISIFNRMLYKKYKKNMPSPAGIYSEDQMHLSDTNTYRFEIGCWGGYLLQGILDNYHKKQ